MAVMEQPGDRRSAPASLALVQDLANTIDIEGGFDTLRRPTDLRAFAAEHGMSSRRFTRDDLERVVEFRELLRVACQAHAGTPIDPRALARLDAMLGPAALRVAIDPDGGAELQPVRGLSGADEVVARVAAAIADGRADRSWLRLKACVRRRVPLGVLRQQPGRAEQVVHDEHLRQPGQDAGVPGAFRASVASPR